MSITYRPIAGEFPGAPMMAHDAKRLAHETHCDYCGEAFTSRYADVVTDRSGSSYATMHTECADRLTVEGCFAIVFDGAEFPVIEWATS